MLAVTLFGSDNVASEQNPYVHVYVKGSIAESYHVEDDLWISSFADTWQLFHCMLQLFACYVHKIVAVLSFVKQNGLFVSDV